MKETKLLAGFAKVNINPAFDCEMSGFVARKGNCRGVHDPLWVRSLVLSDGKEKLVIAVADLIGLVHDTVQRIRTEVAALTDIPPEHVIVSTIHTHAGPATIEHGYLGKPDPDYLNFLVKNIAGSIYAANQELEPVVASVGISECKAVGKNRRHQGGPTDPAVSVLRLGRAEERKILLANYTCHPVVLGPDNLLLSADYPYYLIKTLEAVYPGSEILFTNGATGDINVGHNAADSINGSSASKRTFHEAERLGRILAGRTVEAVETAEKLPSIDLSFASRKFSLCLETVPDPSGYQILADQFAKEYQETSRRGESYGLVRQAEVWTDWAKAMKQKAENGELDSKILTEVAAFRIGNVEFATLPGEFFHELGLMVKRSRPGKAVFIIGYANDLIGYVGTSIEYDEGGYEINESYRYFGMPTKLARGAGERVIDEVKGLLQK